MCPTPQQCRLSNLDPATYIALDQSLLRSATAVARRLQVSKTPCAIVLRSRNGRCKRNCSRQAMLNSESWSKRVPDMTRRHVETYYRVPPVK